MAEFKDIYILGQSQTGRIEDLGEEIKLDLSLEKNQTETDGTVYGDIVDEEGNPLDGVTVKITDVQFNPLYHSVTDNTGHYTIHNVPADNQYYIVAQKDLYKLQPGVSFIMQESQQLERNFTMQKETDADKSLVAGEIKDDENNPIANACIKLYDNSQPNNPVYIATTFTNDYGQFLFFDVEQNFYLIEASKMGYKVVKTTFVIDADSEVRNIDITFEVDPITRQGTINGIITNEDGNVVPGAFVILYEVSYNEQEQEVLNPIRRTTTDSNGLYLFEQVEQGEYRIKSNKTILEP